MRQDTSCKANVWAPVLAPAHAETLSLAPCSASVPAPALAPAPAPVVAPAPAETPELAPALSLVPARVLGPGPGPAAATLPALKPSSSPGPGQLAFLYTGLGNPCPGLTRPAQPAVFASQICKQSKEDAENTRMCGLN